MSITTSSPLSITRDDTSWCGLAPFGPEPTITNAAPAWPSSTIAAAMSAPTCSSVRPGFRNSPIRACTRSIAAPAARSSATSAASLRIRSSRVTGPARNCAASGSASRIPNTCAAGMESATAIRVGPPARSLTSRYGSSSSVQVITSTPSSASPSRGQPGRLQAGHHDRRRGPVPGGRHQQAGQPLVARAGGADQVAQIGAGGDEQQLDVVLGRHLAGAADAVGELCGRDGRCHGRQDIPASSGCDHTRHRR